MGAAEYLPPDDGQNDPDPMSHAATFRQPHLQRSHDSKPELCPAALHEPAYEPR
jgi:hypothetical protein